ncbi:MAG TPA: hypothetical protein VK541_08355 [Pedobacter sp.]|uniref:hypothetical protein n=1 Tax=Pedobacter sp. TaxID=1411316 RepID=UPI002B7A456B|nr:hypothetical protein [Pedobacter sp.]HMI02477.1 hypothetical protein [Pedobacter sp.]
MKLQHHIILSVLFIFCMAGCQKSVNGPVTSGAEVNFFNAADGIFIFPGVKAVYMDKLDTTQADPIRFSNKSAAGETFPALINAGPDGVTSVLYMKQIAGSHRFIFTNGNKRVVADTTLNLTAGSKNTFYAYDDPDKLLSRCRIMHIVENEVPVKDQCRFRLLHLGGDLGGMNCFFILEDGTRVFPANLPVDMKYGAHTNFITIDPKVAGKDGNAYLQFFSGTDTATVKATATIPYRNGRSYAVVVSGLAEMKFVQYQDPANPGSIKTIQLNPAITARVRTLN